MKKLLLFFVVAMTLIGCATSEERAARQAAHMEKVKAAVGNQQYRISLRSMTPLRSTPISLSGLYYLKVNGNEVMSDMPYLGREDVPHFKTRSEMRFDSRIELSGQMENYILTLVPKEKTGIITFKARNKGEECVFKINIYSDGQARILVKPESRDEIKYEGYVDPIM